MKKALILVFLCAAGVCYGYDEGYVIYDAAVLASSELRDSQGSYPADNLIDKTWHSWAEAAPGNGVGESFTIFPHYSSDIYSSYEYSYSSDSFREGSDAGGKEIVAGFILKNGYGDLNHYSKNNRVKSFRIFIDGKYSETIAIKDSPGFEQYAFKTPVESNRVRFVIDSVYPGTAYNDTCVAEAALITSIRNEDDFYRNVLREMGLWDGDGDSIFWNNPRGDNIPDIDKLMLVDYMPFDTPDYKTKIARLNGQASLKLSENLPRLDGATAAYPLYSAFVYAVYPEKPVVQKTDYQSDGYAEWGYFPSHETWWKRFEFITGKSRFESIVQCSKTDGAYRRLIDGEADIIFCYEPSRQEIAAAAAKGKNFNLTPIGKDAFVFIVNNKNISDNITQQQIRDIYSGRLDNWKSITGVDDIIIPFQREENSGSQTIMQAVMQGDRLAKPILGYEYISGGMFASIRIVASDYYNYNSAIGYTFLFYLTQMAGAEGVKALSIDGVKPDKRSIQNNTYPFSQTVYAVTTGNESENTKRFIEWILSPQGQELVEKTGYVPVK